VSITAENTTGYYFIIQYFKLAPTSLNCKAFPAHCPSMQQAVQTQPYTLSVSY